LTLQRSQFIEDTVEPSLFLPGIISLFIMCVGIIRNNSLVDGRAGPSQTPVTERVTLYCTWRPSALTTRPREQVKGQGYEAQKHCRRGSRCACKCWLLLPDLKQLGSGEKGRWVRKILLHKSQRITYGIPSRTSSNGRKQQQLNRWPFIQDNLREQVPEKNSYTNCTVMGTQVVSTVVTAVLQMKLMIILQKWN